MSDDYFKLKAQKDRLVAEANARNEQRNRALMEQLEGTLMGKLKATEAERDELRTIAQATRDTLTVLDEWLGMASTRNAALDSMRRLGLMLGRVGIKYDWRHILDWRLSLIEELWQARFYSGPDGHWHYVPGDPAPVFGNAEGPELAEIVGRMELAETRLAEARDMLRAMWLRAGGFVQPDGSLHPGVDAQMAEVAEWLGIGKVTP